MPQHAVVQHIVFNERIVTYMIPEERLTDKERELLKDMHTTVAQSPCPPGPEGSRATYTCVLDTSPPEMAPKMAFLEIICRYKGRRVPHVEVPDGHVISRFCQVYWLSISEELRDRFRVFFRNGP